MTYSIQKEIARQAAVDRWTKRAGWILFILVLCFFLWFGRTTPEDVAKCTEATGWSAERCRVELSR